MKHFYFCLLLCISTSISFSQRCNTTFYSSEKDKLYARPYLESGSRDTLADEIITIPVVIHILYNNDVQNISDAQVNSQLDVLNKDYRRLNSDTINTPKVFAAVAADIKIRFCLAKTDPSGKPTTGIIRKYTAQQKWDANDGMKFSSSNGDNAWDSKKYLNIWVCNLTGSNLGYSSLPGSQPDKDGVVIQYDAFGNTGTVRHPFDKGRTATHEIGHWLGLQHLWGDALCGDDHIDDTPPQKTYNNGCPSFPHLSTCSINGNGDMFMNYMDFSDDACMNMFTVGQKNKMRSMFAIGGARNSFLNSNACNSQAPEAAPLPTDTTITKVQIRTGIKLYPNPTVNVLFVESLNGNDLAGTAIKIYNVFGREVLSQVLASGKNKIEVASLPTGIYFLHLGNEKSAVKFVKQ